MGTKFPDLRGMQIYIAHTHTHVHTITHTHTHAHGHTPSVVDRLSALKGASKVAAGTLIQQMNNEYNNHVSTKSGSMSQ